MTSSCTKIVNKRIIRMELGWTADVRVRVSIYTYYDWQYMQPPSHYLCLIAEYT